jgi:HK97 family phage portal protein
VTTPSPSWQSNTGHASGGGLDLYGATLANYAEIYRTQPNIRIGVEFVARNVAQLGIGIFRRVSDTDRLRLTDHELNQWLTHPNPWTTRFRLIDSLMQDLGTYNNAYWLKVRMPPGSLQRIGLVRVPPAEMTIVGRLQPEAFLWTQPNGVRQSFDPSEFVYVGGYDPSHPLMGLSMLFTMRRILAEEAAAGDYRQSLWGNSTRMEGVIERPVTAKKWTDSQRQDWREQWQDAFASGGARPGSVAVLEDGMSWKPISFSAKDSEYVSARKLVREYCAASQHIPQPFVGILDHATFSNIREQHKNLYQDTLGPSLEQIQQEIERQLLPECLDQDRVYVEFNIQDKLKGSFEEQATSLQQLVGRPIMTANEGRARLNLPSTDNPKDDELAPQQGGPAAAPGVPPVVDPAPGGGGKDPVPVDDEEEIDGRSVDQVIQAHQVRQRARLAKLPIADRPAAFSAGLARWNRELCEDLRGRGGLSDDPFNYALSLNTETLRFLEIEALDV